MLFSTTSIPTNSKKGRPKTLAWPLKGPKYMHMHIFLTMYFIPSTLRTMRLMKRQEHHLHARWRRDGQELFSRLISEPVCGIAVSRNDKFVAVVGTSSVYVYELGNGALHHHSLPPLIPPNRLDSQRIDFSADCEEVLVATRGSERGVVQVYDNKCTSPNTSHSVFSIEVPRVSVPSKRVPLSSKIPAH